MVGILVGAVGVALGEAEVTVTVGDGVGLKEGTLVGLTLGTTVGLMLVVGALDSGAALGFEGMGIL